MNMGCDAKTTELDPRVRRTRQMLQDALSKLLLKKDFERISVQDIAEVSTLNRATFYAHYSDKFALLEAIVGARFRELIEKRGIRFSGCTGAVKAISIGVCDYLSDLQGTGSAAQHQPAQAVEMSIISLVRAMIVEGLKAHLKNGNTSLELLATTAAWAIYGAAQEWVRMPHRVPVDRIAESIEEMITPMFAVVGQPGHRDPSQDAQARSLN